MLRLESLDMPEPVAASGGQPLTLAIDSIDEDPEQPRTEFDPESLRELAETIARRGVRQPISVRPHPERPGRWILNFGARRLRASKLAGKADIPAFVDDAADSYDQVIENEQREGLKPLELAMFVKRRLARGETQTEIARLLGKTQPYVAYVSALIDAPNCLMEVYRSGRCRGVGELYHLRRLHARHASHVEAWLSERSSITRSDVQSLKAELEAPVPTTALASHAPGVSTRTEHAPDAATAEPANRGTAPARGDREHAIRGQSTSALERHALFARMSDELVEIIADRPPKDRATVYVRRSTDSELTAVSVDALRLVGFLRTNAA